MDELVRWYGEQLDIDEATVRAATPGPWYTGVAFDFLTDEAVFGRAEYGLERREHVANTELGGKASANAAYIAAHDPARALREIDAKRDLLRLAERAHDYHETFTSGFASALERTLRLFALAYADRPGYREEWTP